MHTRSKISSFRFNFWGKLAHTLRLDGYGQESSVEDKQMKNDVNRFVTVTPSGSVSVELGTYLKSSEGRKQIDQIRELRDFTRSSNGAADRPASSSQKK